jgi:hypothetical protein
MQGSKITLEPNHKLKTIKRTMTQTDPTKDTTHTWILNS